MSTATFTLAQGGTVLGAFTTGSYADSASVSHALIEGNTGQTSMIYGAFSGTQLEATLLYITGAGFTTCFVSIDGGSRTQINLPTGTNNLWVYTTLATGLVDGPHTYLLELTTTYMATDSTTDGAAFRVTGSSPAMSIIANYLPLAGGSFVARGTLDGCYTTGVTTQSGGLTGCVQWIGGGGGISFYSNSLQVGVYGQTISGATYQLYQDGVLVSSVSPVGIGTGNLYCAPVILSSALDTSKIHLYQIIEILPLQPGATGNCSAYLIHGLILGTSGTLSNVKPTAKPVMLVYGDSIVGDTSIAGPSTVADVSKTAYFPIALKYGLSIQYLSFPAAAVSTDTWDGGSPVTALSSATRLGYATALSPKPSFIFAQGGTNDRLHSVSASTFATADIAMLNGLLAIGCPIYREYAYPVTTTGDAAGYVPKQVLDVAACTTPSLVTLVDSTGIAGVASQVYNPASPAQSVDGIHPTGPASTSGTGTSIIIANIGSFLSSNNVLPSGGSGGGDGLGDPAFEPAG